MQEVLKPADGYADRTAMRARFVLLALVGCTAVAACGSGSSSAGGSSPSTAATASITKASYIEQANAICADMNAQAKASSSKSSDPIVQAASVDRIIDITRTTVQKLRDLPTPPGDAETLSAIYADVDRGLVDSSQLAAALHARNIDEARSISQTLATDARTANDAANAYGLTVCGAT